MSRIPRIFGALLLVATTGPLALAQVPELDVRPPVQREQPAADPVQLPRSEAAVRAMSGLGMYVWRWERSGTPDEVVRRAAGSGLSHLVVRASSSASGFYLQTILSDLLPKAHAAGLRVVAYDPPRFEDVEADVRRAHELLSFRASGHAIDAFAADIEPRWDRLTPEAADRYGARLREVAGPDFPLVAIIYPPNHVSGRYPFTEVARHFDLLAPMSYWRARTTDAAAFVGEGVHQLSAYGRPVAPSGQAFSYDGMSNPVLRGHPPRAEIDAAIASARASGAVGMTFWVWEHADASVFESIAAAGWSGTPRPGVGVRPHPVRAYAAPVPKSAGAAAPSHPAVEAAERAAAASPPQPLPARAPDASGPLRALALALAATSMVVWLRGTQPAEWDRFARALVSAAERGAGPIVAVRSPAASRSRPGSGRSAPSAPWSRAADSG